MDPGLSHTIGNVILGLVALAILSAIGLIMTGVVFVVRGRRNLGIVLIAAGGAWMLPLLLPMIRGY